MRDIIHKSHSSSSSAYVPLAQVIVVHNKEVQVEAEIKSLDPPCLEDALSYGDHPYTCSNCASQMRELKDILKHRKTGTCNSLTNRIGHVGFNKRYARKEELSEALTNEVDQQKDADKQVSALLQVKLSPLEWENQLQESCRNGDDQKLIVDLARLFKSGISKTHSVQVIVIKNLVLKLLKSNNHHYVGIVKDISSLNWALQIMLSYQRFLAWPGSRQQLNMPWGCNWIRASTRLCLTMQRLCLKTYQ